MYYVYILKSHNEDKWFIGSTENLTKEIIKYNEEKEPTLKDQSPLKLVYCEACLSEQEAQLRMRHLNLLWQNVL